MSNEYVNIVISYLKARSVLKSMVKKNHSSKVEEILVMSFLVMGISM